MRPFFAALILALCAGIAAADPAFWRSEWPDTDFANTTLTDWTEIRDGGPPRDGIPALTDPAFVPALDETALDPTEAVLALALDGAPARAYPLRYLIWHEIVNDTVAGRPIAVTWCPLCNSAVVFDRETASGTLDFGVSGKLRHSDMIMFDRQTDSWWQQATGTGIVGALTGVELEMLPGRLMGWDSFRRDYPDGLVMAEPAGVARNYGRNPYDGYDTSARPFLYSGDPPPFGIEPLARVIRVGDAAWPLERLRTAGEIQENGLTLTWEEGQASALDARDIGQGREVGNVRVTDATGADVVHDVMFAFAFDAFWPEGDWMLGR